MWFCLNLVCGPEGTPSGVLLRGGEITTGADLARAHRPTSRKDSDLAQGPARLATALTVDRALNGADACAPAGPLRILTGTPPPPAHVPVSAAPARATPGATGSTATPPSVPTAPTYPESVDDRPAETAYPRSRLIRTRYVEPYPTPVTTKETREP